MKRIFFLTLLFFAIFSCKKKEEYQPISDWKIISKNLRWRESGDFFELISGQHQYKIERGKLPFRKCIFLNSSLLGYVSELGCEDRIAGVSSPEYIFSDKILELIKSGKIQSVGNEQKYDVEKIIAMKPDAVFTNYISTFDNTYKLLKNNGIQVIFLDEYLEQNPLEKMKYLEVFGQIFGMDKAAESKIKKIEENYFHLKETAAQASAKPTVFANEMYGNQWFMPGGKTFVANYLKDAGAQYILSQNEESKAVPLSFEEVLTKAGGANFWVDAGNHQSRSELLGINANYNRFNAFKNGNVYAVDAAEKVKANDFFESGVVRADLVLSDYIKIFHPDLLPNYRLTYMKKLR